MSDNNLTTSTSAANEELEKPSAQHNVVHQHHHVVQQSTRSELIDKLGGEAQPLGLGLPVPVVVPQSQLTSPVTKNVAKTGSVELTLESPSSSTTILAAENDLGGDDSSEVIMQQDERTGTVVPMDDTPVPCETRHEASGSNAGGAGSPGTELISKIDLEIAPSIGDTFQLKQINYNENVNNLKKVIINKLKLQSREQISLLYRDKVLAAGSINDYGICNGSRVTLLPSIETGLLTQRPEQSVLEALEGLNETQINDFLSGKSPLNLTMRLGEHVMLIQLQLSKGQALAAAAAAAASHSKQCQESTSSGSSNKSTSISKQVPSSSASSSFPPKPSETDFNPSVSTTPNPTLAEASRNLTKTLKRISSKVNKVTGTTLATHSKHHRTTATSGGRDVKCDDEEIINLKHHGKGVYSGTFSGTLNPALQDNLGKPRKHVSTIVHILNDLLGTIDLRTSDPNGEIGLKSASIGGSNCLKRKKVSCSKTGSSSSSALTNTNMGTLESTDSEESHDSCSAKPAVALKLPKLSSNEGGEQCKATTKNNQSPDPDAISKDEENRLLRLKIEKLKENLLARKLKRKS